MKKYIKRLIFPLFLLCSVRADAQQVTDCRESLDKEPSFVRYKLLEKDSLLKLDIAILKCCGNFEEIDSVFLKGPMLGVLMLDQVRLGKPATYRTLIDYFDQYKQTLAYKDFVKGLKIYKELALKKVNLDNWEYDKELFVRMGFTVADLDDFKAYLSKPGVAELNYKAALTIYMKEIEAMRVDR